MLAVCAVLPAAALLEIFLPGPCPCCGEPLPGDCVAMCGECQSRLVPTVGPRCGACGCFTDEEGEPCISCLTDPPPFEEVVIWGEYDGVLRQAILGMKHHGFDQLAPMLAGRLAAKVALEPWSENIDLITAVPSHVFHRLRRGFSAAGALASGVAQRLRKPRRKVLRKHGLGRQAGLTRSRRLRLSGNRFSLRPRARVAGKRVLLIDDVTTTGTTLRRSAEALCAGGPAAIYCAAMAWVPDPRRIG